MTMPEGTAMREWYVTCWYCGNTVNAANAVRCPYCHAWLFLSADDYRELEKEGARP